MVPINTRVRVKPSPMPSPSSAESSILFFEANISARPRMMQFTTISGRYTPRELFRAGRNALTNIIKTVTKVAMIVMYAGSRTFPGITFRSADTATPEQISTKVALRPMPSPLTASVVTASVGQVPKTSRREGFSFRIPFHTIFHFSFTSHHLR